MAHLHHAHAATGVADQLVSRLLEHAFSDHRGTCGKIIYAFLHVIASSLLEFDGLTVRWDVFCPIGDVLTGCVCYTPNGREMQEGKWIFFCAKNGRLKDRAVRRRDQAPCRRWLRRLSSSMRKRASRRSRSSWKAWRRALRSWTSWARLALKSSSSRRLYIRA